MAGAAADGVERLHAAARRLRARARADLRRRRLPALWFVTDPERTPEPERTLARLPRGTGVIFRGFGAPDAADRARRLAAIARRRGLVLLVGLDPVQALEAGADGVHLPERASGRAGAIRRARPGWIVTAAAHSLAGARAALRAGADAALVSPVFASRSPSAGRPLGPVRFAAIVRAAGGPVYALGGVNEETALRLLATGAVGIACVEALAEPRT